MCIAYLDDILLITSTYEDGLEQVQVVIKTLLSLGFVINNEHNMSCTGMQISRFLFNTLNITMSLPLDKKEKLSYLSKNFYIKGNSRFGCSYGSLPSNSIWLGSRQTFRKS